MACSESLADATHVFRTSALMLALRAQMCAREGMVGGGLWGVWLDSGAFNKKNREVREERGERRGTRT